MKKIIVTTLILTSNMYYLFGQGPCNPSVSTGTPNCAGASTNFVPINDLGTGTFNGKVGGLYPGGSNFRPATHNAAGLALAQQVVPLNAAGNPDPVNGKIVMLTVGMSNCNIESCEFDSLAPHDPCVNPKLVIVNGGVGGCPTKIISASNPSDPCNTYYNNYWSIVNGQILNNVVNANQVQVVWYKNTNPAILGPCYAGPTSVQAFADSVRVQTKRILNDLKQRFPNLKLCYIASRISARYVCNGCPNAPLNPEPYAYWQGWAMKDLIADQINGDPNLQYSGAGANAPWLSWGMYLWSNGNVPQASNPDVFFNCTDYAPDGTHPSLAGARKIGNLLLCFFKTDSTSYPWFTAAGTPCTSCLPTVTGVKDFSGNSIFKIYPNPMKNSTTISIDKNIFDSEKDLSFTLFDVAGNVIRKKEKITSNEFIFEKKDLAPGVYLFQINGNENNIANGKILIE